MSKRAALTFAELALFIFAISLLVGGCNQSKPSSKGAASPAPKSGGGETAKAPTQAAPPEGAAEKVTADSGKPNTSAEAPLIPREVLFGNPQRAQARLSPDGKWLSYQAPDNGVLNIWVAPVDDLKSARTVSEEKVRPITSYHWAYDNKHILYLQDVNGDENDHLFAIDVANGTTKDLTPIKGVKAQLENASEKFPDEILVGLNDRDPQYHDIYRINIQTGDKQLVLQNPGVAGFVVDDDYRVRMAVNFMPNGGQVLQLPEKEGDLKNWKDYIEFGPEDGMSGPAGFDKTGQVLYLEDSRNRNTVGLFTIDLKSGNTKLIADDPRTDVGSVLIHPTEKNVQAVSFTYARSEWKILDPAIAPDIAFLKKFQDGDFIVTSRTQDDSQWTVAYVLDNGPVKFYRYVRTPERKMEFLFNNRDDLGDYPLVKMYDRVIKSRDGLDLVCYLSLPPGTDPDGDGVPNKPVPLVLDVHGGPWVRDGWGLNGQHQWLANRGYAVLSVNYRGSTGFGKNFVNAANGEWSGKMHNDLLDAVQWAVDQKVADKEKVAIMGGSYGGYATLVGLTFTPDVFACGVDIVGPSSLVTLLQNVPDYWRPSMPLMKVRIGDVETEEGRAELLKRSPLALVDKINKPLLIGQGKHDPRVKQLEADQIVKAMEDKKIPVTYVLFPDEGHGFHRPANNISFQAVTEAFLAKQLGGRFQPVGDEFKGSTITVPVGADQVPGLPEALAQMPKPAPETEKPAAK